MDKCSLIIICAWICVCSWVGTTIRAGILLLYSDKLTNNINNNLSVIFPLLYPQILGCFVLGFVHDVKKRWPHTEKLHVGLSSGLCGSLTTFSSWMFDIYKCWDNSTAGLSVGYKIINGLTVIIVTLGMSFSSYDFGRGLSVICFKAREMEQSVMEMQTINSSADNLTGLHEEEEEDNGVEEEEEKRLENGEVSNKTTINLTVWKHPVIYVAIAGYIGMITLLIIFSTRSLYSIAPADLEWLAVGFSLSFSPLGSVLRLALALKFNLSDDTHYLQFRNVSGTFIANILGTLILSLMKITELVLTYESPKNWQIVRLWTVAVITGFCGCLTTLSTMVAEMNRMRRRDLLVYLLSSLSVALVLILSTLGVTDYVIEQRYPNSTTFP